MGKKGKKPKDPVNPIVKRRSRMIKERRKIQRLPPGFLPTHKYLTMKIAFPLIATSVAVGVVGFANINISSMYDIMGSTGARQYYGTSIMFQMYKYAVVLACRFKLECMAPIADSNPFCIVGRIQPTSAQDTNIDQPYDFYEQPYRTTPGVKMFGNYITKNLNTNNKIYGSYSAKKYFGKDANIGSDPAFASTVSSNPDESAHLGIYWTPPPGASAASTEQYFMFTATAIVKWYGQISIDND